MLSWRLSELKRKINIKPSQSLKNNMDQLSHRGRIVAELVNLSVLADSPTMATYLSRRLRN